MFRTLTFQLERPKMGKKHDVLCLNKKMKKFRRVHPQQVSWKRCIYCNNESSEKKILSRKVFGISSFIDFCKEHAVGEDFFRWKKKSFVHEPRWWFLGTLIVNKSSSKILKNSVLGILRKLHFCVLQLESPFFLILVRLWKILRNFAKFQKSVPLSVFE